MASVPLVEDEAPPPERSSLEFIAQIAQTTGDLSSLFDESTLNKIGADVVTDYERDLGDRQDWETKARKALKRAAQEREELVNAPPYRKSNIDYPILTVAAQQFNARAYPAICKSGDIVKVKVIGSDKGRPAMGPDDQPMVSLNGQQMTMPEAAQLIQQIPPQTDEQGNPVPPPQPQPLWAIPPGAKQERADRVSQYMNTQVEYRMDDWEVDTDLLLTQIPIIGCGFRKCMWRDGPVHSYVSALNLIVPQSAKSLRTTPRTTEHVDDGSTYPYQIAQRIASGLYRKVDIPIVTDDDQAPRLVLEQHRLMDMDGDGLPEPYVVTVDKETSLVLRIEANFSPDDVHLSKDGSRVVRIDRTQYYVKYSFLPDPNGGFYDIGFGHLIEHIGDVLNASINQMIDAGHAQIAGGGFIASGLRLQAGNRSDVLRWMPGEYKMVSASSADLRAGIYERTFPAPSPILYSLLELMLGAAKEIASVKDIVTGDAPNTAPVGTTLALIEQGLQVFTAIYKRVYRSEGEEFMILFHNTGKYGGDAVAQDYMDVLDDPAANFEGDFGEQDIDIKPVADPSAVTSMQRIAKAQVLAGMRGQGLNDLEINRRILEAANIENIDALMPPAQTAPDPVAVADLRVKTSQANLNDARAAAAGAQATKTGVEVGHKLGESSGDAGGASGMDVPSGDAMGAGGSGAGSGGPTGGMGSGVVGPGGF